MGKRHPCKNKRFPWESTMKEMIFAIGNANAHNCLFENKQKREQNKLA